MTSRLAAINAKREQKFKVGDQWFYRGNRSPTWLFVHERADGSISGISEKVPFAWWLLLEEIAKLRDGIQRALDDSESGDGWGPDVTVCNYLLEALAWTPPES